MWSALRHELEGFLLSRLPVLAGRSATVQALLTEIHLSAFDPGLNVKALRSRCGARNHNVTTQFKLEVGTSVMDYVAAIRMDAAAVCMTRAKWPVVQVAAAVGYRNVQTFHENFRAFHGQTPGEWQKDTRPDLRVKCAFDALGSTRLGPGGGVAEDGTRGGKPQTSAEDNP
jgi:AraC-like DNA-binding protein